MSQTLTAIVGGKRDTIAAHYGYRLGAKPLYQQQRDVQAQIDAGKMSGCDGGDYCICDDCYTAYLLRKQDELDAYDMRKAA